MALPERAESWLSGLPELQQRLITGSLLALAALIAVIIGGYLFIAFVLFFALLMIIEWRELTLARTPNWRIAGFLYVLIPSVSLLMLRHLVFPALSDTPDVLLRKISPLPVIHLIAMVAATDIGAYAAGRKFGKRKLAPAISPGKTWEGLAGGMVVAGIVSALFSPHLAFPSHYVTAFALGLVIAAVSQAGDLFESSLKRRAGVKDSGQILPGHGGALDRFDGLMFAAPVYLLFALFAGGVAF